MRHFVVDEITSDGNSVIKTLRNLEGTCVA